MHLHIQTVIFQRGDPIANPPHLELTKARKSKIHFDRKFFLNFFLSLFFGFWSVLQRLSEGLVVVLAG